jgi:hypothetical protein
MVAHILGCGQTGQLIPEGGHVIGVNDSGKFNKPINELLFLNRPRHFSEPCDLYPHKSRLQVIKETNVKQIVCLETIASEWELHFPGLIRKLTVTRWRKEYTPMQIYHVDSSPFTAMSYAVTLSFKEIILWGVDFINHKYLKAETSSPAFNQFASAISKQGVVIYKGHESSNLSLPVWKHSQP